MNVLFVDDEVMIGEIVVEFLEEMGHNVTYKSTIEQGIEAYKNQKFDIILTDQNLPGKLTGLDLAKFVRDSGGEQPIFLVTGFDVNVDDKKVKAGVDVIINKPFDFDALTKNIELWTEL